MATFCSKSGSLLMAIPRCSCSNSSLLFRKKYRLYSNHQTKEKITHFGFEEVSEQEKTQKVYKVFENVASSYDKMNDAMSLGIHRLWKDRFIRTLNPPVGTKLLDVAGGTGDIAFRFLNHVNKKSEKRKQGAEMIDSHVTVCDINRAMLQVGQQRAERQHQSSGISWVEGDAEELPIATASVDAYTIAFGIRNVTRIHKALSEAHRVLVPGGRFLCLEFSEVKNELISSTYEKYSFDVIPVMGQIIAGDWKSYQYLVESIRQFPNQEKFAGLIQDAGFSHVTHENLTFGIAAIHSGFKL
ncbi:2-methoxy-6-polyprenyl-1,4-benzoquinol methylase, mitochondrial-like [Stylophora pistillata]|uniref:2-methoxy-6-polyprenyl-1,4-benzoquinol methylase, mitochondrial n=1 Tax=Stylophora pistillata TaxID=50429 RepID=A0A2B4SJ42_STYPI|nr:2-methoxy-6-polyprenyl-1,4-benzoquinol methylase, mitochondrial-like [Stylophora pistillata]PFX28492.1 2-methoxy-6-polyprenyl-1,4-benzoquinol methylase, mitochondrial [Stylophora pistillata]